MKMKWISIYLSIYLSHMEMDKWTFRGQNDNNDYTHFSFCQGRLQGLSLTKYLILKHRETEREKPVHREENIEIKTWT